MSRTADASVAHAKHARTDFEVLDAIRRRWSPKTFADRPVEPEKLRQVLEAARWAPSAYNEQPWRFLLATKDGPEGYARLLHCLSESNRAWAQTAPVLMVTVARARFSRNDKPNRHAWHDVGLAVGNLLAQATALDLCAHQMAGIHPERLQAACSIPEGFEPVAGVALGYLASEDALSSEEQEALRRPRSRRPLRETVFEAEWDVPAGVATPR